MKRLVVWSDRGWLDLSRLPPKLQDRAITTIYGFAQSGEGIVHKVIDSTGREERVVISGPLFIFVDYDGASITVHQIGLKL